MENIWYCSWNLVFICQLPRKSHLTPTQCDGFGQRCHPGVPWGSTGALQWDPCRPPHPHAKEQLHAWGDQCCYVQGLVWDQDICQDHSYLGCQHNVTSTSPNIPNLLCLCPLQLYTTSTSLLPPIFWQVTVETAVGMSSPWSVVIPCVQDDLAEQSCPACRRQFIPSSCHKSRVSTSQMTSEENSAWQAAISPSSGERDSSWTAGGQGAPTPSQFGPTPVTGTTFHSMTREKGNTHQRRTGDFAYFGTEDFQSWKPCDGLGI